MINVKPFNAEVSILSLSRTIKAQYFKMGAANVLDISDKGNNYKATGVIVSYE